MTGEGWTHLYVPDGDTLADRIRCGDMSAGVFATKVTEWGPDVTCPRCRELMERGNS